MPTIRDRLSALGYQLPVAPTPVANYKSFSIAGSLLSISGQISSDASGVIAGILSGREDIELGKKAAETAALNVLAQIAAATDGKLSTVHQIVRLGIYIASAPTFSDQSNVANGASDLIVSVFGDVGHHSRAAIGVASLPAGAVVEIEALVEIGS